MAKNVFSKEWRITGSWITGSWILDKGVNGRGKRWWKGCWGAAEPPWGAGEFAVTLLPLLVVGKNHVLSVGDR